MMEQDLVRYEAEENKYNDQSDGVDLYTSSLDKNGFTFLKNTGNPL